MSKIPSHDITGVKAMPAEDFVGPDCDDIRGLLNRLPRHRLVVLGPAGAGKSHLARELVVGLLKQPFEHREPVLVSAAVWDPTKRALAVEIAAQATARNRGLAEECKDGQGNPLTHAQAAVDRGRTLPIIDGLDEMPRSLRSRAVEEIISYDGPLVVTSRTDEYLHAIDPEAGRVGPNALVVELRPLLERDIKQYLELDSENTWNAVLAELNDHPYSPLSEMLANPLMLWLTCMVYRKEDPRKLVEQARFVSRATIERRVLAEFVSAVYVNASRSRVGKGFRCKPEQAERWLRFLAGEFFDKCGLSQKRLGYTKVTTTADLAWWQLTRATRGWRSIGIAIRGVLLAFVIGALLGLVLERNGDWPAGAYVGLRDLLLGGPLGRVVRPTIDQLFSGLPSDLRAAAEHPVTGLYEKSGQLWSYLAHQGLFWLLFSLLMLPLSVTLITMADFGQWFREWLPQRATIKPAQPLLTVTTALMRMLTYPLVAAAGALAMVAYVAYVIESLSAQPGSARLRVEPDSARNTLLLIALLGLIRVASSFTTPIDTSSTSPQEALRSDRRADFVLTVSRRSVFAAVVGLFCGMQMCMAYAAYAATATAVGLTMGGRPGGRRAFASRSYVDARFWLACRRRLPWNVMDFLEDARERGVLRQVGAVYQFRHIRLQQALRDPWERQQREHSLEGWRQGRWVRLEHWRELRLERRRRLEWEASLATLNDSLENDRRLASAEPSAPRRRALAGSLWERARTLADLHRWEEAATDQAECAELYGELAAEDRDFLPVRASALVVLTAYFRAGDSGKEWLRAVNQALYSYHELLETNSAEGTPDRIWRTGHFNYLAGTIHEVASWSRRSREISAPALDWDKPSMAGQFADACRTIVEIYRRLAETDRSTFLESLVTSLSDLSSALTVLQRQEEASAAADEAADLLRELLQDAQVTSPSQRQYLGGLLSDLVLRLWKMGRREEALAAGEPLRQLIRSQQPPEMLGPDRSNAHTVKTKIRTYLLLMEGLPFPHHLVAPWVAQMIMQNRYHQFETCRGRVKRDRRWVAFFEKWTRRKDEDASPNLVRARGFLVDSLKELAEAQRKLADAWDELTCLLTVIEAPERADAAEETWKIYRQVTETYQCLNESDQGNYLSELAKSLEVLASQFHLAGREAEAQDAATEAEKIRRRLRAGFEPTRDEHWRSR